MRPLPGKVCWSFILTKLLHALTMEVMQIIIVLICRNHYQSWCGKYSSLHVYCSLSLSDSE